MVKRKIMCGILCMGLIFSNNIVATAAISSYSENQLLEIKNSYLNKNFLVLGDSIGTGYGLSSEDFSYGKKLSTKLNMNYTNLAVNGSTSKSLLDQLNNEDYINKVKEAEIINISIGGNDVMLPLLDIINRHIHADDENSSYSDLLGKYEEFYNDLLNGKYDEEIKSNISYGLKSFEETFPKVIERIKSLNPNSKIVLQTVYNPLSNIAMFNHVCDIINPYINELNSHIINAADNKNVVTSDVAFYMKSESGLDVSNIGDMDIHPDKYGHNDIYLSLYKTLTSEYPNNINFNLNNANCTLEYNNDNLSPTVYIYTDKGYRAPMYLYAKYDNLTAIVKTEKISNGVYKAILPSRCLYGDITVTGTSIKIQEDENNSSKDDISNTDTDSTLNTNIDNSSYINKVSDKDNNSNLETNTNESSSKKLSTYDYLYKFLLIFILALTCIVTRFIIIKTKKARKE